ncbi:MAG TPA: DUF3106 domain-containing protein [Candidatus Angelobacter sp.]|jgi:hypothetical protein|nr:DUF3106 domain-containing protein [Candidatus Angelobacter sp.]
MLIGPKVVSVFVLAGLITLNVPSRVNTSGTRHVALLQAAPAQQKSANNANRPGQKAGRKMGDWLAAHKNLPPDQQLKLLESEPAFKKLPPEKQNALRDRLTKFNNLPPEKRTQALQRMEFLSKLTPQQRQQLRDANQQLQGLPPERQVAVHKAVRHLRQMPAPERQQVIQSDRFRSTFSDQEQKLISELTEMSPANGGSAQNPQPK